MKVVINSCYGGFSISEDAKKYICEKDPSNECFSSIACEDLRFNEHLIDYIEKYGSEKASGTYSRLGVEDIPKGAAFVIDEYDGFEDVTYRDEIDWIIAT